MRNTISATELKNKVADVLNHVVYTGSEAIVVRHGKPLVKIVPFRSDNRRKIDLKKALNNSFGSLPDFPDVTKFRCSRRRKIPALF